MTKYTLIRRLLVYSAAGVIVFSGCRTIQYVPVTEKEYVTVHDTTKIHTTDTLVKIPEVSIGDFIDLRDSLHLKADYAEAVAWVDPAHNILAGRLVQTGTMPVKIQWKERLVYRDSITTKEVPVPVEVIKEVRNVPLFYKIFTVIGLALVFGIAIYLGLKFL